MSIFDKWMTVVFTTINPLTGRGVSIPLGIGFGLPAVWLTFVVGLANFLVAVIMVFLINRLESVPRIKAYIDKKRGKTLTKFVTGKGLFYAVVIGPFLIGTFATVLAFQALGANKKRMVFYSLISTIIITPVLVWIFREYKDLFLGFFSNFHNYLPK